MALFLLNNSYIVNSINFKNREGESKSLIFSRFDPVQVFHKKFLLPFLDFYKILIDIIELNS